MNTSRPILLLSANILPFNSSRCIGSLLLVPTFVFKYLQVYLSIAPGALVSLLDEKQRSTFANFCTFLIQVPLLTNSALVP